MSNIRCCYIIQPFPGEYTTCDAPAKLYWINYGHYEKRRFYISNCNIHCDITNIPLTEEEIVIAEVTDT
jgi:hypothetical protein